MGVGWIKGWAGDQGEEGRRAKEERPIPPTPRGPRTDRKSPSFLPASVFPFQPLVTSVPYRLPSYPHSILSTFGSETEGNTTGRRLRDKEPTHGNRPHDQR